MSAVLQQKMVRSLSLELAKTHDQMAKLTRKSYTAFLTTEYQKLEQKAAQIESKLVRLQ